MTTCTTEDNTLCCDKCGRPIPSGKGYIYIDGWIICGLCQYESGKYIRPIVDPNNNIKDDTRNNYTITR